MKIIFHDKFYKSDYADNGASVPGRMEVIMEAIRRERTFEIVPARPATEEEILLDHPKSYIDIVRKNDSLYEISLLAAGASIMAADIGFSGEPAFACIRPPGHHASRESAWGYCTFSNMGIALLSLKAQNKIKSAFILDFDTHTGDGTKDVLRDWKECKVLNPYAENRQSYIKEIDDFTREIASVDIIAVCAGFDSYEKDIGKKLSTSDFYNIGVIMKQLSNRVAHGRRFAILEGGYYLPDLGINVTEFCKGFRYGRLMQ